jgi:hypothetical protein
MDLQKFLSAALRPRDMAIDVPDLAEYFGEDEKPVWVVRGLTAAELARANQSADKGVENLKALVAVMAGSSSSEKAAALRNTLGLNEDEVPVDVSRRIEMLAIGSVSPEIGQINRDVAVKIAEYYPTVFYSLTNQILTLTGQGAEVGKPKRSGKTPA